MASRSRDVGAGQILCAELFRWWRKYHPGEWKSNALDDNSTCCRIEEELRREKSALESANEKTNEDHAVVITKRDTLMARASNLEQLLAAARGDLELANIYRDRALVANENLQRALSRLDVQILRTLCAIKSGNEKVYDNENDDGCGDDGGGRGQGSKPKRYKDVVRKQILEQMKEEEAVEGKEARMVKNGDNN